MSNIADAESTVFSMRSDGVSGMVTSDATRGSVTRLEERQRPVRGHSGMGGPRVRNPTTTYNSPMKHIVVGLGEMERENPPTDGGYLTDHTLLRRRQSAKQLIHRFESLTRRAATTPYERPPVSTRANSDTGFQGANHPFLTLAPSKSKRRSLSNSLRNLMTVFKKRRDKDPADDDYPLPSCSVDADRTEVTLPLLPPKPATLPEPSVRDIALSSSKASALLSGPLLYLSKPSPSATSILPVWTPCTVTLHDSHLLITWYTLHGNPSSQVVPLEGCTDVRSLALKQLDANERALLPTTSDLKVLVLLFEGRSSEKFAAASSQERAQWVSMIWDTVPGSREGLGPSSGVTQDYGLRGGLTVQTDVTLSHPEKQRSQLPQPPSASEQSTSEYSSSSVVETPNTFTRGDSAPPTPVAKSPRCVNSPMALYPPKPPSQLSTYTRPKSPSIAKLGALSVVTQRLAEISQTESASSTPTTNVTSSTADTTLQRAQVTFSTGGVTRAFAEIERIPQENGEVIGTPDGDGDASVVIPLPDTSKTLLSDTASVRSRSVFSRMRRLPTAPAPRSTAMAVLEPIPQSSGTLTESATIRTNPETLPHSSLGTSIEPRLAQFAELIKDSAAKHYDQTAGLGEQIIALQRDIHRLPQELQPTITRESVTTIQDNERRQAGVYSAGMNNILEKLDDIKKEWSQTLDQVAVEGIVNTLESVQVQLKLQIPEVMGKLVSIEQGLQAIREISSETHRSSPKMSLEDGTSLVEKNPHFAGTQVDLSDIRAKLDDLASLSRENGLMQGKNSNIPPQEQSSSAVPEKLQAIMDLLKASGEQRELQMVQQADSVRYLNELNSWLDAFVNNGTAQIQAIATGVQQLCEQLGICEDVEGKSEIDGRTKILPDLKRLLSSVLEKVQDGKQLQVSMDQLINAVHEHLRTGTDQRNALVTDSVLAIIDRQRLDQEQMLRALSSELTNEIRGERLRFVEAMKEATAINVQAHVEHFKAELGREVAVMTEDVGRLHQEKQALEQQIADLFAFYSKKKQEADTQYNTRRTPTRSTGLHNLQNLPVATNNEGRRPLPNPIYCNK